MSVGVIIALVGLVSAMATLLLNRLFSKRDKAAEKDDEKLDKLRQKHNEDMESVNTELTVICYGVLASLKGLAEKGCDGPVHEAIDKIEKHLNKKAHEVN